MRSYPKVHHLGDPVLEGLLDGEVSVEEKLDGSQFRINIDINGMFNFGSHRVEFPTNENNQMFQVGVENCMKLLASIMGKPREHEIHIFCEFMKSQRQNTLTYDRVPKNNIVIFDIIKDSHWYSYEEKSKFANKYGFEVIPRLYKGTGLSSELINELIKSRSFLGGTTVEGIVVKNYNKFFNPTKYAWMEGNFLIGKYVRQEFHELNQAAHAQEHSSLDVVKARYNSPARWDKAIQKLTEEGKLLGKMQDIPALIMEIKKDVREECENDIKDQLWKVYGSNIVGSAVKGFPEYYNQKLLKNLEENKNG